jgi:hypothetical protein
MLNLGKLDKSLAKLDKTLNKLGYIKILRQKLAKYGYLGQNWQNLPT